MPGKENSLNELAKRYDRSNMANVIERIPAQIEIALNQSIPAVPVGPFNKVVVAGMGGSALPVDVITDAFAKKLKAPIWVSRYYNLRTTVDDKTLVIISSFSGNTEETLSVIQQFTKYAKNIAVISGGGRLTAIANEKGYPLFRIPRELELQGFQPRSAIGYFITLFARLLYNAGLIDDPRSELESAPEFLRDTKIRPDAEEAAKWLQDKIPVVYTDEAHLMSIARIAKIKFNENSKRPAFFNAFPEVNHNEMLGFSKPLAEFGILYIHDPDSNPRVISRYNIMKELFKRKQYDHVNFWEWEIPGTVNLHKIMAAFMYTDWCSYSLALLDGIDPTPIDLVESFKHILESSSQ